MRLFWKFFCSMVLITTLSCSIGGFLLIDQQFQTALNREVTAVYEENDMLRYAISSKASSYPVVTLEVMETAIKNISIETSRGPVSFRMSNEQGESVGGNQDFPLENTDLVQTLEASERGWKIVKDSANRVYLHSATPIDTVDGGLFLENCRDVTEIYQSRTEQYRSFTYLMIGMVLVLGVLIYLLTYFLLKPLKQLSAATRQMAEGTSLEVRVPAKRQDELGDLSRDFNTMAEQIQRQVQELKDASQRQEDFIASFAHEIKTPLTSIIGYADLMQSRPVTPNQMQTYLGYIFSEGQRLERLSRKLLDLIVLKKQKFHLRSVPLDTFLGRVGAALSPTLEKCGIGLTVRSERISVQMEPDLMETMCMNLVDNARKALSQQENGEILLEGYHEGKDWIIRVSDNGRGIPPEELARVTEAFYMVDKSRARAQGGAGLGLALCQRIAGLHGGSLQIESVVNRGTRVTVRWRGVVTDETI